MASFRWFPFTLADGAHNMAADEVLLQAAAEKGIASLRFYGWTQATVSLGYFQAAAIRRRHARLAPLPWVRRASGGKLLVHHHELTYALALPPGFVGGWMARMHQRVILPALNGLGLAGQITVVSNERPAPEEVLCFLHQTTGDLVCSGKKVVGSAQRKHRKALLQHGAILLAQSEHAANLPGIKELTGMDLSVRALQEAILEEFQRETGWQGREGQWSPEEEKEVSGKSAHQYATVEWNEKR
jgi:lipoate-protein ligase A